MNEIKLRLITPLWTGDIDSKSYLVQTTGIIGSLRWWTEAILRGLNYFACDPTGEDDRCPKETQKNSKKLSYCSACLIFGATGIRRLFKLQISGGQRLFDGVPINIKPKERNRGWYLGSGLIGDINLNIIPLDKAFNENLLYVPLNIASNWGGLGAKTQIGYGVVKIKDKIEVRLDDFKKLLEERLKKLNVEIRNNTNSTYPNLKEMFFAKVRFNVNNDEWWKEVDGIKPYNSRNYSGYRNDKRMISWINSSSVPIAPAIKNWLRFGDGRNLWVTRSHNVNTIETWLFGTTRNQKSTSKINISCAYRINTHLWELRIWGWIPLEVCPTGFDRNGFLNNLQNSLSGKGGVSISWDSLLGPQTNNHRLVVWREFNCLRDTLKANETDMGNFVHSLLNNNGGS